jgi:Family of unknown function (DUF6328)
MLVLVVQVLLGFDYRAVFESSFESLPLCLQYTKLGSLAAQLLVLGLLLAIPSYHRLVENGENTEAFCVVIRKFMTWSLPPFAMSLGGEFAVAGYKVFGLIGGICSGVGASAIAYFFWHVFPELSRRKGAEQSMDKKESVSLTDKIKQILTESRVVLPGTQALLGFQLITFLTQSFEKLPYHLRIAHCVALTFTGISAILLMTPPAYHRIAEAGEASAHFYRLASRFLVAAMVFLALGLSVDFYVVLAKVTQSLLWATIFSACALLLLYGFWFVYPLFARCRSSHLNQLH